MFTWGDPGVRGKKEVGGRPFVSRDTDEGQVCAKQDAVEGTPGSWWVFRPSRGDKSVPDPDSTPLSMGASWQEAGHGRPPKPLAEEMKSSGNPWMAGRPGGVGPMQDIRASGLGHNQGF